MPEKQRRPAPAVTAARQARATAENERRRAAALRPGVASACAQARLLCWELTRRGDDEPAEIFMASFEPLARLAAALDERQLRGTELLARLAPRRPTR